MRVCLYARVSTDDGKQDTEVQFQALRKWSADRGWTVVAETQDRITGDPGRRRGDPPGLRQAVRMLENKKADGLAVFSADRIVRSPIDLLQFVSRVRALGAHVMSLSEAGDLDTTTEAGELITFLHGWLGRMYLRLLRARTKAGLERAKAAGKVLGRRRADDAPDPIKVSALRQAGSSWTAIGAELGCHPSAARRAVGRIVEIGGHKTRLVTVENASV